jgi:hypothetical protein
VSVEDVEHSLVDCLVEHGPIAIVRTVHTMSSMVFPIERDHDLSKGDDREGGDVESSERCVDIIVPPIRAEAAIPQRNTIC